MSYVSGEVTVGCVGHLSPAGDWTVKVMGWRCGGITREYTYMVVGGYVWYGGAVKASKRKRHTTRTWMLASIATDEEKGTPRYWQVSRNDHITSNMAVDVPSQLNGVAARTLPPLLSPIPPRLQRPSTRRTKQRPGPQGANKQSQKKARPAVVLNPDHRKPHPSFPQPNPFPPSPLRLNHPARSEKTKFPHQARPQYRPCAVCLSVPELVTQPARAPAPSPSGTSQALSRQVSYLAYWEYGRR